MRRDIRRQQGELGKKKTVLIAEVSYQEGIQLNCCMDGMIGDLRGNTWRNWRRVRKNGRVANSSEGRILKGGVMS